jgi:hypothetical protein
MKILPDGRVDQLGMIATLASWRPRVQIPPRPPLKNGVLIERFHRSDEVFWCSYHVDVKGAKVSVIFRKTNINAFKFV